MNCAGEDASNSAWLRYGAPHWANGMDPESYQASITCGTRRKVPSSPGSVKVISSMNGRCGSRSDRSRPVSSESSASDPTATSFEGSASLRQMGSGVPQYRSRDSAQSTLLRSQSPYRPHWMVSGCQCVFSFSASNWSLIALVRMYQDGCA